MVFEIIKSHMMAFEIVKCHVMVFEIREWYFPPVWLMGKTEQRHVVRLAPCDSVRCGTMCVCVFSTTCWCPIVRRDSQVQQTFDTLSSYLYGVQLYAAQGPFEHEMDVAYLVTSIHSHL